MVDASVGFYAIVVIRQTNCLWYGEETGHQLAHPIDRIKQALEYCIWFSTVRNTIHGLATGGDLTWWISGIGRTPKSQARTWRQPDSKLKVDLINAPSPWCVNANTTDAPKCFYNVALLSTCPSLIWVNDQHSVCPLLTQEHSCSLLNPIIQHFSLHRNCLTVCRSHSILHFLCNIEELIPHLTNNGSKEEIHERFRNIAKLWINTKPECNQH